MPESPPRGNPRDRWAVQESSSSSGVHPICDLAENHFVRGTPLPTWVTRVRHTPVTHGDSAIAAAPRLPRVLGRMVRDVEVLHATSAKLSPRSSCKQALTWTVTPFGHRYNAPEPETVSAPVKYSTVR